MRAYRKHALIEFVASVRSEGEVFLMWMSSQRVVCEDRSVAGPLIGHLQSFKALRRAGARFDNERYTGASQATADKLWLPAGWQQLAWERKGHDWIDVMDLKKRTRAWILHRFTSRGWEWDVSALCRFMTRIEWLPDGSCQGTIVGAEKETYTVLTSPDFEVPGTQRSLHQLAVIERAFEQWFTNHEYFDWSNPAAYWDEL